MQITAKQIKHYTDRLGDFHGLPNATPADVQARLATPFPFAVYGTLRKGCNNNIMMDNSGPDKGWRPSCPHPYTSHSPAHLPGYYADSIQIFRAHGERSSTVGCPFEIYSYADEHFAEVLPPIDRLESFSPQHGGFSCYIRCLAWLTVLPAESWGSIPEFTGTPNLHARRFMKAPPASDETPAVPCWIYCSRDEVDGPSIIWTPTHFEKPTHFERS